ncbi:MAG: hypothetical protein SGJ10_01135 [Bacteroidota bacterium]|nr:hypothetical protein [Bacteroidota bacterium]
MTPPKELDNDIIIFVVLGILFFLLLSSFVVYIIILFRTRRKMFIENEKQLKMDFEKSLLESQVEIREELLKYVAMEIHDNLNQTASVIRLQLISLGQNLPENFRSVVNDSKEQMEKLIGDMKALGVTLKSEKLSLGFIEGLQQVVQRINNIGRLNIELTNDFDYEFDLDVEKQTFLFRISQEIINNVLKHAKATKLEINITNSANLLMLRYNDDGIGFDKMKFFSDPANMNTNHGLKNLSERCKLISADLDIASTLNKGTKIIIKMPI